VDEGRTGEEEVSATPVLPGEKGRPFCLENRPVVVHSGGELEVKVMAGPVKEEGTVNLR